MERCGEQSDRGGRKREIEAKNQALAQLRQERAEVDALIEAEQAASLPVQEPEPAATPIDQTDRPAPSWDEQKAAAQSLSNSPIVAAFEKRIRETGEIREYGLGKNWYDRSVALFENLYSRTVSYVETSMQKYVGRWISQHRNIDPDR
jgi:hypothetical protein